MKPVARIAQLRQCAEYTARAFCENVQRLCKGSNPKYERIADYVAQMPKATPDQIAAYFNGTVASPLPAQEKPQIQKRNLMTSSYDYYLDEQDPVPRSQSWGAAGKNPLRSLNRLEPSKARTCPHGIPFYRKCGICDKEEFSQLTGLG